MIAAISFAYESAALGQVTQFGGERTWPRAINNLGVVVGHEQVDPATCGDPCVRNLPFIWHQRTGLQLLPTLGRDGRAEAINSQGDVVGYVQTSTADGVLPALWRDGQLVLLSTFGNGFGEAQAINDSGRIAGRMYLGDGSESHPFVWDEAQGVRDLGALVPGGKKVQILSLLDDGSVFGTLFDPASSSYRVFIWNDTQGLREVDPLNFAPSGINQTGTIAGTVPPVPEGVSYKRAAISASAGLSLLPLPAGHVASDTWDINAAGDVAGGTYGTGSWGAIWTGNSVLQFPDQIGSGGVYDVNDTGQALVFTYRNNVPRSYVWRYKGIEVYATHGGFGGTSNLAARIVAPGVSVANKTLAFAINGVAVGTAGTDGSGYAAMTASIGGLALGFYPNGVEVSFGGDLETPAMVGAADITVVRGSPALVWESPTAITTTTPLGNDQLNATAVVPGAYDYSPAAGTYLLAGRQQLWVTFTPLDVEHYTPETRGVWVDVNLRTTASEPIEQPPVVNCLAEHDFAVDELQNRVYGVSGAVPAVCDVTSGALFQVFPDGSVHWPRGVAVDGGRQRLYTTDYTSSLLFVFDTTTGALVDSITMSGQGFALVVDPSTGRVYVAGQDVQHSVMVVDPTLRAQIATIESVPLPNSFGPSSLAIDVVRRRLFWTDHSGLSILDIDSESPTHNQVVQTLAVNPDLDYSTAQVVVNRVTGRVYFAQGPSGWWAHPPTIRTFIPGPTGYVHGPDVPFSDPHWGVLVWFATTRLAVDTARDILYARIGDSYCYAYCVEALASVDGTTGQLLSLWMMPTLSAQNLGGLTVNPISRRIYMALVDQLGPSTTLVFQDSPAASMATSSDNPSATAPGVNVSFTSVQTAGQTTITPVEPSELSLVAPGQFTFESGLAFEISTTAQISGPISVCFSTGVSDPTVFNSLHLLHAEGGVWVDRTTSRDYASGVICGATTSLSPFVVARRTTPGISLRVLSDPTKVHKRGSTAPIKVQVLSGTQNVSAATLAVTAIEVRRMSDETAGVVVDAGNANPDLNFRFDPGISGGGYIFNLSTKTLQPGRYDLRIKVGDDPTVLTTPVQVR